MEIEFRHCDLEIKEVTKGNISFSQMNDVIEKLTISIADTLTTAIDFITKNYEEIMKTLERGKE
jgi:hypothetical protein